MEQDRVNRTLLLRAVTDRATKDRIEGIYPQFRCRRELIQPIVGGLANCIASAKLSLGDYGKASSVQLSSVPRE